MQLRYITQHYTTLINIDYTTTTTATTTTTTTALHHTTSSSCGEVTIATIATTPKNTTPTTFRSISDSLCHPWFTTTNLSYRFPIFEISATALCGTTGIYPQSIWVMFFIESPNLSILFEAVRRISERWHVKHVNRKSPQARIFGISPWFSLT